MLYLLLIPAIYSLLQILQEKFIIINLEAIQHGKSGPYLEQQRLRLTFILKMPIQDMYPETEIILHIQLTAEQPGLSQIHHQPLDREKSNM